MVHSDAFKEIIEDTCKLVKQTAQGRRKAVSLSPEVAAMLDRVQKPASPKPAAARETSRVEKTETELSQHTTLEALEKVVSVCKRCPLSETRTQTVFGTGNPHAELVFVGEAPGHDEDVQGKPFVGRAGQLLTDIIEKGFKISRRDVYICNVLKCRPPNNRNPLPSEVAQCEPYLIRQLELLQPKVICALGTYAAQTLLKTDTPIGKLRGKWHFYHGIPLRATYHPAYLLRNPGDKVKTWDDVKEIIRLLEGKVDPKSAP